MSVDVGRMVSEGFERTIARNGLLLVAGFYVVSVINQFLAADLTPQPATGSSPMTAPSLGIPVALAGVLLLVMWLVSTVLSVGAVRTFATERTESLDQEDFTRNLPWVVVNFIVGAIVLNIILFFGFIALIVPGLFLAVSLFFWYYFVVVDGDNFIEGFQNSWELTSGSRLSLFLLGVVVTVIVFVTYLVFSIPAVLSPLAGVLVTQLGAAFAGVFLQATGARTFVHLTGRTRDTREPADAGHAVE